MSGLFLRFLDDDQYREEFIALVQKQTERDFSIQGEIGLVPSLLPTIAIEKISPGNPEWASKSVMLSIDRRRPLVALLPLSIDQVSLHEPVLHLAIGPDGTGNWPFRKAGRVTEIRKRIQSADCLISEKSTENRKLKDFFQAKN